MIQVQIRITAPTEDQAVFEVDVLEREDASPIERELAQSLERLHLAIFDNIPAALVQTLTIARVEA